MRRPNPLLRPNSKRDSDENPYHPLAKVLNYKHRNGVPEDYPDAVIDNFELRKFLQVVSSGRFSLAIAAKLL